MRLIDADELLKHKGNCYDEDGHLLYAVGTGDIINAPAIEAEPQKLCYPCLDFDGRDVWLCSNCDKVLFHPVGDQSDEDTKNYIRYCHFCGRKVKWDAAD